jgi:Divergent InlB B-repeat domain
MRKTTFFTLFLGLILLLTAALPCRSAVAGETSLSLWGDQGDYIVGNQQLFFTADNNNTFTVTKNFNNGVSLLFHTPDYSHWWQLDFAAPYNNPLTQGSYPGAKIYPYNLAGDPGLALYGDDRACDSNGTFQVKQVVYGAGETIESFWATFEQHCVGSGPGAYGEFRFNADITADSVVVAAPLTVSIPRAYNFSFDVSATSGDNLPIALTATELPAGAAFVDNGDNTGSFFWTPAFDQGGQYTIAFRGENGSGLGDTAMTVVTVTGPTSLSLVGQPGDYIIGEQHLFYTPADGFFMIRQIASGILVSFDFTAGGWDLGFAAGNYQPLSVGLYNDATQFPYQGSGPGLDVSGDGRGCNSLTGSFEVKQIVYGAGDAIDKFWATFEQHCEGSMPAAFGEILFNADAVMLKISKAGNGHGSVSSTALGIDCGRICARAATQGSVIDLQAVADSDSVFTGWSGDPDCVDPQITLDVDKFCTATFTLKAYSVTIQKTGSGAGTVLSTPAVVDCGATCAATVNAGTLSLTAKPAFDSVFIGWSGGACNGAGTCVFTVAADTTVTAEFSPGVPLSVVKTGTGDGSVTSTPGGINCGATCARAFTPGTAVTLTATPFFGSFFVGWSGGACSGTGTCTVALTSATQVTADFVQEVQISVAKSGSGSGTVTSSPAGIDCGTTCSANLSGSVTLTATPAADSVFVGWSGGGCSGTGPCTVTVDGAVQVTASFQRVEILTIELPATGFGRVIGSGGIDCTGFCQVPVAVGTVVTLQALPAPGFVLTSWYGDFCSGPTSGATSPTCTFTFIRSSFVTAYFNKPFVIAVTKIGSGSGTVRTNPVAIDCGEVCSMRVDGTSPVVLVPTPSQDSIFTGWGGDECRGMGDCILNNVSAHHRITANFALKANLWIHLGGTGFRTATVKVSSGTDCTADCSQDLAIGTPVTLNAVPGPGSVFLGWSGDGSNDACSGTTPSCSFIFTGNESVAAYFGIPFTISLAKTGGGSGTVTSLPAGINCGSACSMTLNAPRSVAVFASTAPDSIFMGWSGGGCSGTDYCLFDANTDTTITAAFALKTFNLSVAKSGTGTGSVTSLSGAINCGLACSATANVGTSFSLTASPSFDSLFIGWSGACSGTGACTVTMNSDAAVTANFSKRLTLSSPNGGEVWIKGTKHPITWTSLGVTGKVKVDYSGDGGTTWTNIISPTGNDGRQDWKVNKPATTQARMRVCTTTAPIICDMGDGNFTIQ